MHILIDGDPIVYRNGVAGEDRTYEVILQHRETGEMLSEIWEDGNEKNRWLKANAEEWEVIDQECIIVPRPVGHALGPIKRTLVSLKQEVAETFKLDPRDITYEVYLTGSGNFRETVAQERPYKGHRDRSMRPYWYDKCREYLIERWNATLIEGYEADDAISIAARQLWQQEIPHVIATVDKDLDQIPGPHYDYGKKIWYHMDEEDAMMFFYEQVLCGDSTDNIPGVWRLGKKKAHDMIRDFCAEWYDMKDPFHTLESHIWARIVETYSESIDLHPDRYTCHDPEVIAIENARLVKMQDYHGQLWTPPGEPDGVIDYDE